MDQRESEQLLWLIVETVRDAGSISPEALFNAVSDIVSVRPDDIGAVASYLLELEVLEGTGKFSLVEPKVERSVLEGAAMSSHFAYFLSKLDVHFGENPVRGLARKFATAFGSNWDRLPQNKKEAYLRDAAALLEIVDGKVARAVRVIEFFEFILIRESFHN